MRRWLIGALLLLCGCGAEHLEPSAVAKIKRVAIISSIGDQMTLNGRALLSFGNVYDQAIVTQWGIDGRIVATAAESLRGRYEIVPVSYKPADFQYDKLAAPLALWGGMPIGEAIRTLTKLQASSQPGASGALPEVDAYVAIVPANNEYINVAGFDMFRQALVIGDDLYHLNVVGWVVVVDGHRFETLAVADIATGRAIDKSLWADSFASLTPAQQSQLAAIASRLVDENLPYALQKVKLIP